MFDLIEVVSGTHGRIGGIVCRLSSFLTTYTDRFCRPALSDKVSPPLLDYKNFDYKVILPVQPSTRSHFAYNMASATGVRPYFRIALTPGKCMQNWRCSRSRSCRSLHTFGHQRWTATSHQPLFLDILMPPRANKTPKYPSRLFWEQPASVASQWRRISTSSSCRATTIAANPRKDEEGNDMVIDITPRASNVSFCLTTLSEETRRVVLRSFLK